MTIKKFRLRLIKIIEESGEFVTYDKNDPDFNLQEDELVIVGEDDKENFVVKIIKV